MDGGDGLKGQKLTAEEWKQHGNEHYKAKDWESAIRCYSSALDLCGEIVSEIALGCLNNRAACHAQMKNHVEVIADASCVVAQQPANIKALLRRMVAFDATGQQEKALADASDILTMEPKNPHALQVVEKQRKGLTKKGNEDIKRAPPGAPSDVMAIFLFTENRPLQCYACLCSLARHLKNARLDVNVFWQASNRKCFQSYQLLQCLGATSRLPQGQVCWTDVSRGQLFPSFSRSINRMSVEGHANVLLLSDKVLFHSDVDLSVAVKMLRLRRTVHSVRLDLNPRINYFPEANLIAGAPALEAFSEDSRMLKWTRWYDKSKQAFEAVPREMGWNAILDWTATIVRVEMVQHFFSALLPQPECLKDLDDKAADWLSRRQRMKNSEIRHYSACYESPLLVTVDADALGDEVQSDLILRQHLFSNWGEKLQQFAAHLGWKLDEVKRYFENIDSSNPCLLLEGLVQPDKFSGHHFDSVTVAPTPPVCSLPKSLNLPSPLVSWLVPARNVEGFLYDCLDSIEKQSGIERGCYEIVLVNDASEDGTLALMRKFACDRPYVRIVDNDAHFGVAGSICAGWSRCSGDFVARIDADDIAEPDRLFKQLKYLEQHPTISILGSHSRSFWTEERLCTIEKVINKGEDRLGVIAWREDHGNQTSRRREEFTVKRLGDEIVVLDCPAEFFGCRVVRIGEESLILHPENWRKAFHTAQGGVAEVILQRRDPLEQPRGCSIFHPLLLKAQLAFEDCIAGTTVTIRRSAFPDAGPYQCEVAEVPWCLISVAQKHHITNLADPLVRTRRHAGNRALQENSAILESRYAAIQYYLTKTFGVDADVADAAALHNFRGPCTPEQGTKLLAILGHIEKCLLSEYVRPQKSTEHDDFRKDFVVGREVALESVLAANRMRFKELADKVSEIITSVPEHSPRPQVERQLPR
mmetsp:Transcript_24238/g.38791  ORF Transcript_24238/g.38791 Transcript_24238/m.38791 type:complete len:927 (+) Transcript_24238:77-2857(+)